MLLCYSLRCTLFVHDLWENISQYLFSDNIKNALIAIFPPTSPLIKFSERKEVVVSYYLTMLWIATPY
jgi:hypothetical protein